MADLKRDLLTAAKWMAGKLDSMDVREADRIARVLRRLARHASPSPLSDDQLDKVLGAAYRKLVLETGYNGGMGGETWDRAAARAIEAAHGIGVPEPEAIQHQSTRPRSVEERPMPCDHCRHPTLCADFPEQWRICGVAPCLTCAANHYCPEHNPAPAARPPLRNAGVGGNDGR